MPPEGQDLTAAGWTPWAQAPRERPVRFWLIGLLGVALAGVGAGVLAYQALRPRGAAAASDEGWGDLAAVVEGALAGILVLLIAWLVLLVLFLRRYLARPGRLPAAGTSIAAMVAAAVALAVLGALLAALTAPDQGVGGTWALTGAVQGAALAGLAAPPVVVVRARRRGAA